MLVKICGITNSEDGLFAIKSKADFIGIILEPGFKRHVDENKARELIRSFQTYPVFTVGVFLEKDFSKVEKKAKDLNLEWVQVMAPKHKSDLEPLKKFRKLLVVPVNPDGSYEPLLYPIDENDYLLYDFKEPGSGKAFNWKAFSKIESAPFFLAGGLTSSNVKEAIEQTGPNGVDTSSGVCKRDNIKKDPEKIVEFIGQVK